jgi:hypothetical protein
MPLNATQNYVRGVRVSVVENCLDQCAFARTNTVVDLRYFPART